MSHSGTSEARLQTPTNGGSGDLSLSTQAKLLRVLQERYIQLVGGKEAIPVGMREKLTRFGANSGAGDEEP